MFLIALKFAVPKHWSFPDEGRGMCNVNKDFASVTRGRH